MLVNPRIPTALNGRRKVINQSSLPALISPRQVAAKNNATSQNMRKWRKALGNLRVGANGQSGTKIIRVGCIGDSITQGIGSEVGTGNLANNWIVQLTKMFNSAGMPASTNSIFGWGGFSREARVVVGNAWAGDATILSIAGSTLKATTAANDVKFTPLEPVDNFTIWYLNNSPSGVFTYSINGGPGVDVNTNAGIALNSVNIPCPLGINTISVIWKSGGAVWLVGFEASNSQEPSIDFLNCGWAGSTSTQNNLITTGYNTGRIDLLACDFYLLALQGNDYIQGVPPQQTKNNLRDLIKRVRAPAIGTPDVVLIINPPTQVGYSGTTPSVEAQAMYTRMQLELAEELGVNVVNIFDRWGGTYAQASADGLMFDGAHPKNIGYGDMAQAIFNLIGNP